MSALSSAMLQAEGLAVSLGGRVVARLDALTLSPGSGLALMGPNGSGKSSLLRALAGLLPLTTGDVRLDGVSIPSLRPAQRAESIACLFQRHAIAFDFTLRELVSLGLPRPDRERVEAALARVGLIGLGERRWSGCSGGEQQRAHIARALVTGARLLLLDEPDNHLDLGARALLTRLLLEERARGVVVVLATHDLDLTAACDEVLLMERGAEVLRGPPARAFGDPRFSTTFGLARPVRTPEPPRSML